MFSLEYAKPNIQRLLNAFSSSMNFEAAVFDSNLQLFICTEKYLKQKGETVHTPYLEEVFSHDKAIVSKPGYMPSCLGCRFNGHCPSTIELLSSIKVQNQPVGIISVASFTKEGQARLSKNLETYLEVIGEFSKVKKYRTGNH